MCLPAVAIPIIAGMSAAVSAGGAIAGGVAAQGQANYEAGIAEQNATYAQAQAADALKRGQQAQTDHYNQVGVLKGRQTASMAANGVDLSFGSPVDVATSTAILGDADATRLSDNTAKERMGYEINAQNFQEQAAGDRSRGSQALMGSVFSAAGSLLGGASSAMTLGAKYGWPSFGGGGGSGMGASQVSI